MWLRQVGARAGPGPPGTTDDYFNLWQNRRPDRAHTTRATSPGLVEADKHANYGQLCQLLDLIRRAAPVHEADDRLELMV